MGYSIVTKQGDGVTTEFVVDFVLGTISKDWISCRVGDETEDRDITFAPGNDSLITVLGEPPGVGVDVVFRRTVPVDRLLYDFQKREPIDEQSLDESHLQLMYAVHEMLDGVGLTNVAVDIDMQGNKLINVYVDENDPDSIATIRSITEAEDRIAVIEVDMQQYRADTLAYRNEAGVSSVNASASETAAEAAKVAAEAARDAIPPADTVLVDSDIDTTVQSYDADTLKSDVDTTLKAAYTNDFVSGAVPTTVRNMGRVVLTGDYTFPDIPVTAGEMAMYHWIVTGNYVLSWDAAYTPPEVEYDGSGVASLVTLITDGTLKLITVSNYGV